MTEKSSIAAALSGLDEPWADRGGDDGDRALATERREARAREVDRRLTRLGEIDVALQRIADGDYGNCLACTRPIPIARLKALPTAAHCVGCQSNLERARDDARYARPADWTAEELC